ncbi:amidase signature enzyme [Gymnopus androsaceus JB14]|uniref:Amidase signature enzyme n=1 Tax=Gymnopus androsaceus JB14 TaxID=1447944 RepID=A0A6A4H000_9AGAR|nr:amidase signature enzyme [Gymnopus androsaceus JB14]
MAKGDELYDYRWSSMESQRPRWQPHSTKSRILTKATALFLLLFISFIYLLSIDEPLHLPSLIKSLNGKHSSSALHTYLPDLYEAGIVEIQAGLDAGHFSSVDLVKAYLGRIDEVNLKGPALHAVIELNPSALMQARALDMERRTKGKRGPLHGIPILLKDNIATIASEGMNTTAGSYSLLGSIVPEDAGVVKKLRKAGAIILGKTNLSEWSQARGNLQHGWSGRGGFTTGAYYPNSDPCGSSSGSGVAASIGLATVTLGTETDGSISCPSSFNNIVGIKPTRGLTSRAKVIPISIHHDSVGPMTRSVEDGAIVLSTIAGPDPNDNYTSAQPLPVPDYSLALKKDSLRGKRIAILRRTFLPENSTVGIDPYVFQIFDEAVRLIESLGATTVHANMSAIDEILISKDKATVVTIDMKIGLNDYLASLTENPSGVRNVSDLIKFNEDHPELEMPQGQEDQSGLIRCEATSGPNSTYFAALARYKDIAATRSIDAVLKEFKADAILMPGLGTTTASAMAGYPIVTVPLGFYPDNTTAGHFPGEVNGSFYPAPGIPIGLSFLGTAFSEFELIGFAYAYEQATGTRLKRKAYKDAIPVTQLIDVL